MSFSPERRKSRKSTPMYLHVWQTLRRIRYSSMHRRGHPLNAATQSRKCLDRVFGVVVVPRNSVVLQKREHVVFVLLQSILALAGCVALVVAFEDPSIETFDISSMLS